MIPSNLDLGIFFVLFSLYSIGYAGFKSFQIWEWGFSICRNVVKLP